MMPKSRLARLAPATVVLCVAALTGASGMGCKKLITAAADDPAAPSASASSKPAPHASASASGSTSDESPTQITFKKKDPQVGSTLTVSDDNSMSFELTKPKKTSGGSSDKAERKIEILGAEGRTINRVKLTYTEKAETSIDEGKETTKRPAVRGKSYVVEAGTNGKLVVNDESRSKLKAEETDVITKDMAGTVGKPDKMLSALPDVPLKVGDSANGLAEWIKDGLVEMGGQVEIKSTTVKLKEVKTDSKGRYGVFDVKSNLVMKQGAIEFKMDLSGTLEVRVDGRPQALTLAGPLDVRGGGAEGTGKLSVSRKMEY